MSAGTGARASALDDEMSKTSDNAEEGNPVGRIVARLEELSDTDCLSVRQVVEAFGATSFLPVMMVPALLVVSPLSGVPLFSSLCGISIALIAVQMVAGREYLWLPGWIMRQEISGDRAHNAVRKMRRVARWLDRHLRARFRLLMLGPNRKLVQALCLICGAAMPFLEFVPFSSSVLGLAVLCHSAALLARDGLFALLGAGIMVGAALIPITVVGLV